MPKRSKARKGKGSTKTAATGNNAGNGRGYPPTHFIVPLVTANPKRTGTVAHTKFGLLLGLCKGTGFTTVGAYKKAWLTMPKAAQWGGVAGELHHCVHGRKTPLVRVQCAKPSGGVAKGKAAPKAATPTTAQPGAAQPTPIPGPSTPATNAPAPGPSTGA